MPRANRYFLPGHVWHITHRCHKQEFLLKFQRDRLAWRYWLYQARRRYGLCALDYIVTSNHYLLVKDRGEGEIAASMRLIASRTAQAYNRRKGRKGAFWEDRYPATAVETGQHLARCLVYIDLNRVCAGVVRHPAEWKVSGYHDIQSPPDRYRVVDRQALADALELERMEVLAARHAEWVENALHQNPSVRNARWSHAIAVGSEAFVQGVHAQLGIRAVDRSVRVEDGIAHLAEDRAPYNAFTRPK
jgi:putative transposase